MDADTTLIVYRKVWIFMAKKAASTAPREIVELARKFDEHRESYRGDRYNETQVRQDFLDPFFAALGWDVYNRKGYAEAYRDVILEQSLRVEKTVRAPDYCFRIGGVPKFFVEAKKPAVDIRSDVGPAFQLRRYAWTAKLPLSILTDFEELAVYDCRVKPDKADKASTARVLLVGYREYVDRWEEIAAIFSRDAILRGSFDKYAESTRKKRGTAEVDEAFLAEIEQWRESLAKNLSLRNGELSDRDLNFSVQRIIDRVIFLRMCEGRHIEPYGRLQSLLNGPNAYARLVEMFHRADEKYNSGLFHFQAERGREPPDELTTGLAVDDRVLKEIVRRLYYPESPYEFAALPADILGQVYEQFLGKVIRLTAGHRAKIEEKPEVRKAGGVYYTPTYIVDYIVQNTVGKLVEGRTVQEVGGLTATFKPSRRARPLAVLDPACGSGSFLIVAYQFLLDWYLKQYTEVDKPARHSRGAHPRIYQAGRGDWRLTTAERKRILLAHVYGVDIDYQACEVTKLSLLLKVLEGETEATLQRQLFEKDRALPDLANNIKCGNSLIGPDFYEGRQRDMFHEDELLRINAFDWHAEFPHIFSGTTPGFDAVIGNPPYRREFGYKYLLDEIAMTSWGKQYRVARMDLWYYFVHRSLELLKLKGLLSFIVNSYWISSTGAKKLIGALRENTNIEELFFFGKLKVFQQVSGQHMILRVRNGASNDPSLVKLVEPDDEVSALPFVIGRSSVKTFEKTPNELFRNEKIDLQPPIQGFLDVFRVCEPLGKLAELRQGIVANPPVVSRRTNVEFGNRWTTGAGVFTLSHAEFEALELSDNERRLCRPYFDLCDLGRYWSAPTPSKWIIYSSRGTCPDIAPLPSLKRHLAAYRPIMEKRRETRQGKVGWWQLHWPRDESVWESAKIVCIRMAPRPSFLVGETRMYVPYTSIAVLPHDCCGADLHCLCGILNSRLLWQWFNHHAKRRGVGLEIDSNVLERVPIKIPDLSSADEGRTAINLSGQVRRIQELMVRVREVKTDHDRHAIQRQIDATDRQIDQLVYQLYGLTDKESALVEEATAK